MPVRLDMPVIYFTFANEQRGSSNMFLRNLKVEREALRAVFDDEVLDGNLETVIDPDVTQTQIFRIFQGARYRDRIRIFHYGGHADSDELMLETEAGGNQAFYSSGLARLLGQQTHLQLVFLNGCATKMQAEALLQSGVPVVIATSRKIPDADATLFSQTFYRGIAGNATIARAFKEAESALFAQHGNLDNHRGVFWEEEKAGETAEVPWKLFTQDEKQLQWKLYETKADDTDLMQVKTQLIGTAIQGYTLTEFLGIGNFGFVFRARHQSLNKEVAIKVSHRILSGYEKMKDIVVTGARGLSALNHPNIVKTYDMGEVALSPTDKRFFVVMEIVEGTRLDKAPLNVPQLNRQELKKLLKQALEIMEGMRAAHETQYQDNRGFTILGVLHGNIKTRKVLLTQDYTPKLIDFMIADLTTQNEVEVDYPPELEAILKEERKEDYMSPEQILTNQSSVPSDIYSIGAVFFELFSGKKVSEVSTHSLADVRRHIEGYNSAIPNYLSELIFKAVQQNPQDRFKSVREMIDFIMSRQSLWIRLLNFFGIKRLN